MVLFSSLVSTCPDDFCSDIYARGRVPFTTQQDCAVNALLVLLEDYDIRV